MNVLLEHQAKELLRRYGIPTTDARLARNAEEAAALAREAGGPVAMKIAAPNIVHKAAAGGVRLNVEATDAATVFEELTAAADTDNVEGVVVEPMAAPGREAIVGAVLDPVFGPVVMCGAGGDGGRANGERGVPAGAARRGGDPRPGARGRKFRRRRRANGDPVGCRRSGGSAVQGKHR